MRLVEPRPPRWSVEGRSFRISARRNWITIIFLIAFVSFGLAMTTVALASRPSGEAIDWSWAHLLVASALLPLALWIVADLGWELAGAEILELAEGTLRIRYEIAGFGRWRSFDLSRVTGLRSLPLPSPGRGPDSPNFLSSRAGSLTFEIGKRKVRFGIGLEEAEARQLLDQMQKLEPVLGSARQPFSEDGAGWGDPDAPRTTRPQRWRIEGDKIVIPFRRLRQSTTMLVLFWAFWTYSAVGLLRTLSRSPAPAFGKTIFAALWLIVWLSLLLALLYRLLGRETLEATGGRLSLRRELFGVGFGREFRLDRLERLRVNRVEVPRFMDRRTLGQRAAPIAFDYGATTYRFGESLEDDDARSLVRHLLAGPLDARR